MSANTRSSNGEGGGSGGSPLKIPTTKAEATNPTPNNNSKNSFRSSAIKQWKDLNCQDTPDPEHEHNLGHTLASLLGGSDLTYAFSALRKALLANDKLPNNHPKKFDIQEQELILTDDCCHHQSQNVTGTTTTPQHNKSNPFRGKNGVTGEALRRFIRLNDEFAKTIISTLGEKAIETIQDTLCHLETLEASLVEFDDQFADKQLVYGITMNKSDKRITVFFRGTVSESRDWATNIDTVQRNLECPPNVDPSEMHGEQVIKVHRGVYNYLNENIMQDDENNEEGVVVDPNKFEKIERRLQNLLSKEEFCDYEVYVSGHSLGGALAELLAFQLAGNGSLTENKQITAVTYASPGVGNHGFCQAFEQLEDKDLLRHIRVTSAGDPVPTVLGTVAFAEYAHTGLNLHVSRDSKMRIAASNSNSSRRQSETLGSQLRHVWNNNKFQNPFDFLQQVSDIHKPPEYSSNLFGHEWNRDILRTRTIEQLYEFYGWNTSVYRATAPTQNKSPANKRPAMSASVAWKVTFC